jgi:hypothetical protein
MCPLRIFIALFSVLLLLYASFKLLVDVPTDHMADGATNTKKARSTVG